jgi:hypothetical protein
MSKYVVLCDCDGVTDRVIAWIDDDRANGGPIRVEGKSNFRVALSVPRAGGSIVTYGFGCRNCGKDVRQLSEAAAADVIDKIIPVRDTLEFKDISALDERVAQWNRRLLPLDRRITEPAPASERRYVIPLALLCRIISKLRSDT